MTEAPKEITVRLKKAGWEVEITCSEQQLKQALESVLSTLGTASPAVKLEVEQKPESLVSKTCRGLILELWQESWFTEERSLSEVHEEIARRGFHYDKTAVSHSLTDLVRENILTRRGTMRNYTYIQKRPAIGQSVQNSTKQTTEENVPIDQVNDRY